MRRAHRVDDAVQVVVVLCGLGEEPILGAQWRAAGRPEAVEQRVEVAQLNNVLFQSSSYHPGVQFELLIHGVLDRRQLLLSLPPPCLGVVVAPVDRLVVQCSLERPSSPIALAFLRCLDTLQECDLSRWKLARRLEQDGSPVGSRFYIN